MELIHTCYRIGEIDRSVAFYEALGFEERRTYARQLALRNPQLARDAGIGRGGGFDEGGVVDVNHAPVEDIADLPGIDATTARRIVAVRDGVGGFSSLEDLGMTMDLPGDVVERLRGRVVCLPR